MSIFFRALAGVLLGLSLLSAQAHDHQHAAAAGPVYHAQGIIKKITPQTVTIAHQAITDLHWPPMTMQFALPSSGEGTSLHPGDNVDFTFVQGEAGYQIVSLTALR